MDRALPTPHPGACNLVVDVLGQRGAFLPELGVGRRGHIPHRIQCAGVSLEGQTLSQAADGAPQFAVHGTSFGPAEILAVLAETLIDQLPVDILSIGQDDSSNRLGAVRSSFGNNSSNGCAFGQMIGQILLHGAAAAIHFEGHLAAGHVVVLAEDLRRQVCRTHAHGRELEAPTGKLLEGDSTGRNLVHSAGNLIDRGGEVPVVHPDDRFPGLFDPVHDLLVFDLQLGIALGLLGYALPGVVVFP